MSGVMSPSASIAENSKNESELDKLKAWVDIERAKGMRDIKFFTADLSNATVESFAKDVNEMLNGKEVPITDLD